MLLNSLIFFFRDEYLYHDEKSFKDKAIKDVQQFDQDFLQPWYKAIVEVIKADELFSDVPAHKLSDAYNLIKEFIRGTVSNYDLFYFRFIFLTILVK